MVLVHFQNAFILPNLHSVHTDPVTFPNPDKFDPEHFLDKEGRIINAEHCIPFSVGRSRNSNSQSFRSIPCKVNSLNARRGRGLVN